MDFTQQLQLWEKGETLQGQIMIGVGILILVAFIFILRSENILLRGSLIPVGLLLLVLIGYGGFILVNRPAHAKEANALYQKAPEEALKTELVKHTNDNKAGKMLIRYVYPGLIIVSALILLFISNSYYKGMALGFILLFVSTNVIDYGFVSRSDKFIQFLNNIN